MTSFTTARSFIDTNILVYTDDGDHPEKQGVALALLERSRLDKTGVVSSQVLQEYFVATTRKLHVAANIARRKVAIFARLDVVQIDVDLILGAIDLHRLHQLSFWDALIVQAAVVSSCTVLYTEDLQGDRRFDSCKSSTHSQRPDPTAYSSVALTGAVCTHD